MVAAGAVGLSRLDKGTHFIDNDIFIELQVPSPGSYYRGCGAQCPRLDTFWARTNQEDG